MGMGWGRNMEIMKINKYRDLGTGVYDDVMSHCEKPSKGNGRYTDVHETSHFISSDLRRGKLGSSFPKHDLTVGYNGFYILNGQAVLIKEPSVTIKEVAQYVPQKLRGSRYKLYLIDQQRHWNNEPLYILDEWNAYSLGGICAVDDYNNDRELERTDAVAGMFEFMVYSTALAMCVEDKCPEYWEKNTQFRRFIQYRMDTSSMIFAVGREIPQFKSLSSDKLYQTWHNSEEGKEFQKFIDKYFTNEEPIRLGFDYL